LARRNLLASIENGKIDEINETIKRCLKEKIIDTDSDIENANRKLAVLLLRKGNYQYSE
jgi:ribosomal protein S10